MSQPDEIRGLARAVIAAARPGPTDPLAELTNLAETLIAPPDDATWRDAARRWRELLAANRPVFARAVLGFDLASPLSELIKSHLTDPAGLRDALALGPVKVSIDAPPAVARRGAETPEPLGLVPTNGIGVALDAGFLRGSGSARREGERYLGSLGLRLGAVEVNAFAVLEHDSILALLGARFTPGIQLSFGFQIAGIGGLVGVNRRIDADALRSRLTSGGAIDTLFPDDPQRRSGEILQALAAFFPRAVGRFVVGPTVELTWVKLAAVDFFTIDLAILVEVPLPARVVVVGSARGQLGPRETPLLYLRIDLLGVVDTGRSLFALDAALVDSHALGIFRVTGSAAARISWGERPYSVLSIGGFYPGFNPEPAQIPPLERVGLALENPIGGVYLRAEGYLAITSNTVQFGGRIEAGLSAAGAEVGGFIALDALVHFTPFWFTSDFSAGLGVRVAGHTFAGISASGTISGPGPVVIHASLSIEILFFEISWSETFTLGSGDGDRGPVVDPPGLLDRLVEAIGAQAVDSRGGDDPSVVRADPGDLGGRPLLVPGGTVIVRQRRMPLGLPLDRVEGVPLSTRAEAGVHAPGELAVPPREWFAPGAFVDVPAAGDALNRPHFERMPAGVEIGFLGKDEGPAVTLLLGFDEVYKPPRPPSGLFAFPRVGLLLAARGRDAAATVRDRNPLVVVTDEQWVVQGVGPFATQTHAHMVARETGAIARADADAPVRWQL